MRHRSFDDAAQKKEPEEKTHSEETILSVEDFDNLTAEIDRLSPEELLARFTPFEITRHFRRDCEVNYYSRLGEKILELYNANKLTLSPVENALLLQNLCFLHLQKGEHEKAREFLDRIRSIEAPSLKDDSLFQTRQAQIRASLIREQGAPGYLQRSIQALTTGLVYADGILDQNEYRLTRANILKDLGLAYLNQEHYPLAQGYFEKSLDCSLRGGMLLFSYAMEDYAALAQARETIKSRNGAWSNGYGRKQVKGVTQLDVAFARLHKVTENYLLYDRKYRQKYGVDMLSNCQDYASHLFHKGLVRCEAGEYNIAIGILNDALTLHTRLNCSGQLYNQIVEWLAKAKEAAETANRLSFFSALPRGNPWEEEEPANALQGPVPN